MTVAEALRRGAARLTEANVPGAARDARWLLAHAIGVGADRLALMLGDEVDEAARDRFDASIEARCRRMPVAQITGTRLFWGREFNVTSDTLDPRPETETLIAAALAEPFSRVLDLGTGTGAIAITLLAERPEASGVATDVSAPALKVAARNAEAHGLDGRLVFLRSDWWDRIAGQFDLIVSNPPYIAANEMAALDPDVTRWEPHLALTDGADGLTAYRAIAAGAPDHLTPGGRLVVEIGPTQAADVSEIFRRAGLRVESVHADFDGRDRVIVARSPLGVAD